MAFWKKEITPDTTYNDIFAAFFKSGGGVGGNALENSDVFSAIKLISDGIASHQKQFSSSYMDSLLKKPNSYQNSNSFWQEVVRSLLLTGNCFVAFDRDKGLIKELRVLESTKVETVIAEQNSYRKVFYTYKSDSKSSYTIEAQDILHFKINAHDGFIGTSPLNALKTEVKATANGLNSILQFFKKGIFANGILKVKEGRLTEEQKATIKANFSESLKNIGEGGTLLVDSTMEYETLPVDTSIFKILDYTKYSSEQIRKVFGIPKSYFGEELTNTKDVDTHEQFHSQALNPVMAEIVSEFAFKLNVELQFSEPKGREELVA